MNNELTDLELEYELEELYILSKHWMQDISFVEAELRFFKEIADKYSAADSRENNLSTLQLSLIHIYFTHRNVLVVIIRLITVIVK